MKTQELGSDTLCPFSDTTLSQWRWGRALVPGDTVGMKPVIHLGESGGLVPGLGTSGIARLSPGAELLCDQ